MTQHPEERSPEEPYDESQELAGEPTTWDDLVIAELIRGEGGEKKYDEGRLRDVGGRIVRGRKAFAVREGGSEGEGANKGPVMQIRDDYAEKPVLDILSQEYPKLGVSMRKLNTERVDDQVEMDILGVYIAKAATRELLDSLLYRNPVVYFLRDDQRTEAGRKYTQELEAEGRLPKNFIDRMRARDAARQLEGWRGAGPQHADMAVIYEERLKKLQEAHIEPLSDAELHDMLKKEIDRELAKRPLDK
jgi:hypothetical protein